MERARKEEHALHAAYHERNLNCFGPSKIPPAQSLSPLNNSEYFAEHIV